MQKCIKYQNTTVATFLFLFIFIIIIIIINYLIFAALVMV